MPPAQEKHAFSRLWDGSLLWLLVPPTTDVLTITDYYFVCAVRRRLGIACVMDGPDVHGHGRLAEGTGGGWQGRHTELVAAWRQVFREAGGQVPDRNIERCLSTTNIPVRQGDMRRLDIVVTCTNAAGGLPLFCDATVVSPITGRGQPRGGTSNRGGGLLERAEHDNDNTYADVTSSGLGSLQCLGAEVYGKWGAQSVALVPCLAHERTRDLHRRVRHGAALGLQHRWWEILGLALQRAVARCALGPGGDLPYTPQEQVCPLADLEVI